MPRALVVSFSTRMESISASARGFTLAGANRRVSDDELAALEADVACFGHGDPVERDASAVLRAAAEQYGNA